MAILRLLFPHHLSFVELPHLPKKKKKTLSTISMFDIFCLTSQIYCLESWQDPSKHVFHIVTDRLNYAAIRMWFLVNPPGKASIRVQNIEEFTWLNASYSPVLKQLGSQSMIDYYFRAHRANSDSNLKYGIQNTYLSSIIFNFIC